MSVLKKVPVACTACPAFSDSWAHGFATTGARGRSVRFSLVFEELALAARGLLWLCAHPPGRGIASLPHCFAQ